MSARNRSISACAGWPALQSPQQRCSSWTARCKPFHRFNSTQGLLSHCGYAFVETLRLRIALQIRHSLSRVLQITLRRSERRYLLLSLMAKLLVVCCAHHGFSQRKNAASAPTQQHGHGHPLTREGSKLLGQCARYGAK